MKFDYSIKNFSPTDRWPRFFKELGHQMDWKPPQRLAAFMGEYNKILHLFIFYTSIRQ